MICSVSKNGITRLYTCFNEHDHQTNKTPFESMLIQPNGNRRKIHLEFGNRK